MQHPGGFVRVRVRPVSGLWHDPVDYPQVEAVRSCQAHGRRNLFDPGCVLVHHLCRLFGGHGGVNRVLEHKRPVCYTPSASAPPLPA